MCEAEAKIVAYERVIHDLTRECEEHKAKIKELQQIIRQNDIKSEQTEKAFAEQVARNVQQAATIKHQSQQIQNPNGLATPGHGQENIAPMNAAYTAPPPQFNMASNNGVSSRYNGNSVQATQQFGNPLGNRQYLTSGEQGSPGPRRGAALVQNDVHTRNSSGNTNPYSNTPQVQKPQNGARQMQATSMPPAQNNSMALTVVSDNAISRGNIDLTGGFQKAYHMVETYARAHVNFVSSEKDGNMPQPVKQALLNAAAPGNAFPFMGKPESRYHLVTKVMVLWINENILKGISFVQFNTDINGSIESIKNNIYQSMLIHLCLSVCLY